MYVEIINLSPIKKKYSTIFETSATALNVFLATGLFSLPYAMFHGGIVMTLVIYAICGFFSYVSLDILISNMEQCCAQTNSGASCAIESHPKDQKIESKPTFINQKTEMALLLNVYTQKAWQIIIVICYTLYSLGSLWAKTVAASKSLQQAISYAAYGDLDALDKHWDFDTYYLFLVLFIIASLCASLGNIENSKILQIIIISIRVLALTLILIATIYSLCINGPAKSEDIVLWNSNASFLVIGNIIMINMLQHTASGILYPLRPQLYYRKTVMANMIISATLMIAESVLGVIAFSSYRGVRCNQFPCEINAVYNLNFLYFPVLGYIINFYQICNIATVSTVSIALRNNIMQMFHYNIANDSVKASTKLMWTAIIVCPILVLSAVYQSTQNIITFTANYSGSILMFLMPTLICFYAIKKIVISPNRFYRLGWCIVLWILMGLIWITNTTEKIYDAVK